MISDILSDAMHDINYYRRDRTFEHTYPELWPELDALVARMDAIRHALDTPPGPSPSDVQTYLPICCTAFVAGCSEPAFCSVCGWTLGAHDGFPAPSWMDEDEDENEEGV